jgi:hypothetical protein
MKSIHDTPFLFYFWANFCIVVMKKTWKILETFVLLVENLGEKKNC